MPRASVLRALADSVLGLTVRWKAGLRSIRSGQQTCRLSQDGASTLKVRQSSCNRRDRQAFGESGRKLAGI